MGWVNTEMFWMQNHMVAPKEQALTCTDCHAVGGRSRLRNSVTNPDRVARLQNLDMIVGTDHTGRFGTNYAGSAACLECHSGKVDEVMASLHYSWRTHQFARRLSRRRVARHGGSLLCPRRCKRHGELLRRPWRAQRFQRLWQVSRGRFSSRSPIRPLGSSAKPSKTGWIASFATLRKAVTT